MKKVLFLIIAASVLLLQGCGNAEFDKKNAYDLLKKQVEIGPRYPGSPGHDKIVDFIYSYMDKKADKVKKDKYQEMMENDYINFCNIIAYFNTNAPRYILLAAHYDSRPTADNEVTAEKKAKPILGANDGASGVAVLMELARVFAAKKPSVGVIMVFFDCEDYPAKMFGGSTHFAENIEAISAIGGKNIIIDYGILLDMVGDKNLNIYKEKNSVKFADDIVTKIWNEAAALGYSKYFIPQEKYNIIDDHLPLNGYGTKCVDIIDFDYAYWHTLDDTADKCSPDSLKIVGDVVASVVYKE
ncbi:MAG: M28 family peptidase [Abditibacteriota bacterium]|nr:M28 family peptidase [Abditibacteriota bacterium]